MACETRLKFGQTIQERATEVRKVVTNVEKLIASSRAKIVIGPQGAVAITGLTDQDRDGVTDACIYRRLMVSGSSLTKAAFERAQQLSGRQINKQAVAVGAHSHDNGRTWHDHKG